MLQTTPFCVTLANSQMSADFDKLNDLQREAASGVGRLKWDAKVRMKQAKLRAAGENVDRQQVVEAIIEESVQAAQDGVMARFDEIAKERGFQEDTTGESPAVQQRRVLGCLPPVEDLQASTKYC